MSPERHFRTEISANRQYNHEFSPEVRMAMLAKLDDGQSLRAVARQFNTTHSSVQYVRNHFTTQHTVKDDKRSGRPNQLTRAERLYII